MILKVVKPYLIRVVLFIVISLNTPIIAQAPSVPEASSFEPIDATDMVNLATGDLSYVMPLLHVPSPGGGYPLSLSYHAGIAMDQESSWVGLGWNINPGTINRNVIGVPDDDHKFPVQDVYYNFLDEYTDFRVSGGFGLPSYGAEISHSSYRGFGGSVNYLNNEVSYNQKDGFSGNIGPLTYNKNDGVGLNLLKATGKFKATGKGVGNATKFLTSSSSFEFDINYNFKDKSLTANFATKSSIGIVSASSGFSISSRAISSGSTLSVGGGSSFNGGGVAGSVNTTTNGWGIVIPIKAVGYINISHTHVKHWIYTNEINYGIGSGAFKEDFAENTDPKFNDKRGLFHLTDVILRPNPPQELGVDGDKTIPLNIVNTDDSFKEINYPSFDNFVVNAQGISGGFSLKYFENLVLPIARRPTVTKNLDTKENDEKLSKVRSYLWERSSNKIKPQFSFDNTLSSYSEFTNNSVIPFNLDNLVTNTSITSNSLNSVFFSKLNGNEGYSYLKNRKRSANVIEYFTKDDVKKNALEKKFIFAVNDNKILDYEEIFSNTSHTKYSIIGFQITANDGKKYHYSLPVYQRELISRTEKKSNPNEKFDERRNFKSYASHWLLTAITGPDFIDLNSNNYPDESDYGYWTKFEYGKWSDAFGWKTKNQESISLENCKDPLNAPDNCDEVVYNSYTKGVRQLYYLNKIKTRTHTALFLKDIREDSDYSNGKTFYEGNSKNSPKTYSNIKKSSISPGIANISKGEFKSYYKVFRQKNLKLSNIVIIKNEDDIYFSNNRKKSNIRGAEFYFKENFERWGVNGAYLGSSPKILHESSWRAEFYDNVLESSDVLNKSVLNNNTIQNINFEYSLFHQTNSIKKLALKKVGFSGYYNKKLIPDYEFSYYIPGSSVPDNWGYSKDDPKKFSLKSIKNPTGSLLGIDYESDHYRPLKVDQNSTDKYYAEGGIRTKSLSLNNEIRKKYEYEDGISTFRPQLVPNSTKAYLDYDDNTFGINPRVYYRKVREYYTANNNGKDNFDTNENDIIYYNEFIFDIPKKLNDLKKYISYKSLPNKKIGEVVKDNETYNVKHSSYQIQDNTSAFARLLESNVYNEKGQCISKNVNLYKSIDEIKKEKIGVEKQTFPSYKRVFTQYSDYDKGFLGVTGKYNNTWYGREYFLHTAGKETYPSVLKSTITTQENYKLLNTFTKHDFLTGQALETLTKDSKGNEFKNEIIPAYTKLEYNPTTGYGMGSKVDNPTNKNMLTQEAMTKSYLKVGDKWQETGAGITTWNNHWTYTNFYGDQNTITAANQKIWRKHKSFVWDGETNDNGTLKDFNGTDDNFNWALQTNNKEIEQNNKKWQNVSTTTKYDHFSLPLETRDINTNYASTKTCDSNSKVLTVCNAEYSDMYFSSAEYIINKSGKQYYDSQVAANKQSRQKKHTGSFSEEISANQQGFRVNLPANMNRTGVKAKFKISVWVEKQNHTNARIHINGTKTAFNGETVFAGNWVLKTHYDTLSSGLETVYITSNSGTIYADDFMLHPVASSMASYVYYQWDELWYIIGNTGLASRFEYDAAGRLTSTYTEVEDFNGPGTGGFKKISDNKYNYKNRNGTP